MKRNFNDPVEYAEYQCRAKFVLTNLNMLHHYLIPESQAKMMDEVKLMEALAVQANNAHKMTLENNMDLALAMENALEAVMDLNKDMFEALYKVYREEHITSILKENKTKMRNL